MSTLGRTWIKRNTTTVRATMSPTVTDLAWIAGFLEGEGSFIPKYSGGRVTVNQVNKEPLLRLMALLGGNVLGPITRHPNSNAQPIHKWVAYGPRARGIMMTVYPFVSARRKQQIRKALGL